MKKLIVALMLVCSMSIPVFAMSDATCGRIVWTIVSNDGIIVAENGTMIVSSGTYAAIDNLEDADQLDLIRFTLKGMKESENETATAVFETIKDATEHAYLN